MRSTARSRASCAWRGCAERGVALKPVEFDLKIPCYLVEHLRYVIRDFLECRVRRDGATMIFSEITRYRSPLIFIEALKGIVYAVIMLARKVNKRVAVVIDTARPSGQPGKAFSKVYHVRIAYSESDAWRCSTCEQLNASYQIAVMVEVYNSDQRVQFHPQDADLDGPPSFNMRGSHGRSMFVRPRTRLTTEPLNHFA